MKRDAPLRNGNKSNSSGSAFSLVTYYLAKQKQVPAARHERNRGLAFKAGMRVSPSTFPSPSLLKEEGTRERFAWFTHWIPGFAEDDGSYGLKRQYLCNTENF